MGKNKITAETLVDKCSNDKCVWNEYHFCKIPSIMLNEKGKCIYRSKTVQDKAKSSR